ncbi:hypothetical protein FQN54_008942 [Arachnomyces sp. PD_36]|nr:hypothetical protein FQN54_008942 [Arachnomyces sp. PD_36]
MSSAINQRVAQAKELLAGGGAQKPAEMPWNPNSTKFPSRKELPFIPGAPEGAAWVWGKDDYIGRLNLITPQRVKAASSEIKTGEIVPLDLPLNVPEQPGFNREKFVHTIKTLAEGVAYDDKYELNTQSGTQWDGFRHFAHIPTNTFYNGTKASDITGPTSNHKCSIHHWSAHGIAARGILLDYRTYAKTNSIPFDPYTSDSISLSDLRKCAESQGLDIRPESEGGDIKVGDILFIRSGFVDSYYNEKTPEERTALALRPHTVGPEDKQCWGGVAQEEDMIDWLHDSYFAAVVGDAPSFERWPSPEGYYLHEYILALWGMPLGEMWDLERLAAKCREMGRWTFFLTSAPANVPAGVSSHANATAIF